MRISLIQRQVCFALKNASIYPYGKPTNSIKSALLNDLTWQIKDDIIEDNPVDNEQTNNEASKRECWAIVGPSASPNSKVLVSSIMSSNVRIDPPQAVLYPLSDGLDNHEAAYKHVSFHKSRGRDDVFVASGSFTDPSARYHHLRGQDRESLVDVLTKSTTDGNRDWVNNAYMCKAISTLKMEHLLDRSYSALSHGQTRRARILEAILQKPRFLILDEPLTGLDADSRSLLIDCLSDLHQVLAPRILLNLRMQDPMPEFITHVALCGETLGDICFGEKSHVENSEKASLWRKAKAFYDAKTQAVESKFSTSNAKKLQDRYKSTSSNAPIVSLKNVTVKYPLMTALDNVTWTIESGDRWVLSGHNGSGKSTLLAIIMGDHPRGFGVDYTFDGVQRRRLATSQLQTQIGITSPEIFTAFPRRLDNTALSGKDVIVTGFSAVYSYREATPEQNTMIDELVDEFKHKVPRLTDMLKKPFGSLSSGDQSFLLLLRALAPRPKLLILDEPYIGLDADVVDAVNEYLNTKLGNDQAMILVSHFPEEWPECVNAILELENGTIKRQYKL